MCSGCEEALAAYAVAVCTEWRGRGHRDTVEGSVVEALSDAGLGRRGPPRAQAELAAAGALPVWLGDEPLHRSHRSALVRKDPAYYRPRFPDVPDDLPYVWPPGLRTGEGGLNGKALAGALGPEPVDLLEQRPRVDHRPAVVEAVHGDGDVLGQRAGRH